MILIPKGLARSFRAAARKCSVARSKGPVPPVIIIPAHDSLKLATIVEGVILTTAIPQTERASQKLIVPMEVLEAVDGAAVELTVEGLKGKAQWESREGPQSRDFVALMPGKQHDLPESPESFTSISAVFLPAFHECGKTALREPSRYALQRIQLNGKAGSVVATDGKSALIWKGFTFPFKESLLVPAIPVFGCKDMGSATEVRVGQTEDHLVIGAGIWTVWLPIDKSGRFPDVTSLAPRSQDASVVGIDDQDAAVLVASIPDLPPDEETGAITLDTHQGVVVRARASRTEKAHEVRLRRSTFAGPPARVAVNRLHLARALALGCRSIRLIPGKPMVAEGSDRTFIAVTLDDGHVVAPEIPAPIKPPRRMLPVKPIESNGIGTVLPPKLEVLTNGVEALDPLMEAEGLRTALAEALHRANRLIQSLKQLRRQRRVMQSAWTSLKSLGLPSGGDS